MTQMINLLQETKNIIDAYDKKIEDIIYLGSLSNKTSCTWEEYKVLADKTYDAGYGGNEVDGSLVIVFKDKSFMSRWEYDGAEGWDYRAEFKQPEETKPVTKLFTSAHGEL